MKLHLRLSIPILILLLLATWGLGWNSLSRIRLIQEQALQERVQSSTTTIAEQIQQAIFLDIPLTQLVGVNNLFRYHLQKNVVLKKIVLTNADRAVLYQSLQSSQQLAEKKWKMDEQPILKNGQTIAYLQLFYQASEFSQSMYIDIGLTFFVVLLIFWITVEVILYRWYSGPVLRELSIRQTIQDIMQKRFDQITTGIPSPSFDQRLKKITRKFRFLVEQQSRMHRLLFSLRTTEPVRQQRILLDNLNHQVAAIGQFPERHLQLKRIVAICHQARWLGLLNFIIAQGLVTLTLLQTPNLLQRALIQGLFLLMLPMTTLFTRVVSFSILGAMNSAQLLFLCAGAAYYFVDIPFVISMLCGIAGSLYVAAAFAAFEDMQKRDDLLKNEHENWLHILYGMIPSGFVIGMVSALLVERMLESSNQIIVFVLMTLFAWLNFLGMRALKSPWLGSIVCENKPQTLKLSRSIMAAGVFLGFIIGQWLKVLLVKQTELEIHGLNDLTFNAAYSLILSIPMFMVLVFLKQKIENNHPLNSLKALWIGTLMGYGLSILIFPLPTWFSYLGYLLIPTGVLLGLNFYSKRCQQKDSHHAH